MLESLEEDYISDAKKWRIKRLMNERILFIQCEGFVRFTRTSLTKHHWMLASMQSHSPFELKILKNIPGGLKVLNEIEKVFGHYRHQGKWFRYEGALKNWIDSVNA